MTRPFQTVRTTFWTRHDRGVRPDDAVARICAEDVKETVIATSGGSRRLEMMLLVSHGNDGAPENLAGAKRHPSGNGIKPECMS